MSLRINDSHDMPKWLAYPLIALMLWLLVSGVRAEEVTRDETCREFAHAAMLARAMAMADVERDKNLATLGKLCVADEEGLKGLAVVVDGAYEFTLFPVQYANATFRACMGIGKPASQRSM